MTQSTSLTIVGNLTNDPELRFTPSGAAVASFTVAVNERKYNRETGQFEDAGATYWKCNVWRAMAENLAESLTKGDHVIVQGSVKDHNFETKEGEKRTTKEIEVDDVGTSLRFATAKPVRVQQSANGNVNGNSNTSSSQRPVAKDDPWGDSSSNSNEAPF